MTLPPRVTTVIPTYRRPARLVHAIRSAQNQTYRDLRICVFDNASGDETEQVVRELAATDPRISYHCHERNLGLLANYNYAMRAVQTEFFSFLADDDMLCPSFYEEAVRMLDAAPDAMFFAARTLIDNQCVGVRQLAARSWTPGRYEPSTDTVLHMIEDHFIGTSCLFRREITSTIGVFEEHASDRNFIITAATRHPFVVSASSAVQFTVHAESFSGGATSEAEVPMRLNPRYVLGLYEELEARLDREGVLRASDGETIRRALWRKYRQDLWWALLTKSFPARRSSDVQNILSEASRYRISGKGALILKSIAAVMRRPALQRAFAALLAWMHRVVLRWREGNPRLCIEKPA